MSPTSFQTAPPRDETSLSDENHYSKRAARCQALFLSFASAMAGKRGCGAQPRGKANGGRTRSGDKRFGEGRGGGAILIVGLAAMEHGERAAAGELLFGKGNALLLHQFGHLLVGGLDDGGGAGIVRWIRRFVNAGRENARTIRLKSISSYDTLVSSAPKEGRERA